MNPLWSTQSAAVKPILTSPEFVFAPWTAGSIKLSDTFCTLDTVVCENCCMKMDVEIFDLALFFHKSLVTSWNIQVLLYIDPFIRRWQCRKSAMVQGCVYSSLAIGKLIPLHPECVTSENLVKNVMAWRKQPKKPSIQHFVFTPCQFN